jgi:WhiB family redox-sensing transcriptional regulator
MSNLLDDLGRPLWQIHASCRNIENSNIFFPERGSSTKEPKAICAICPVREECLDYALMNGEKFGIWGGMSERERRKIRKLKTAEDPDWKRKLRQRYGLKSGGS